MASGEFPGATTPLIEEISSHLKVLQPLLKDTVINRNILIKLPETFRHLSQQNVSSFLETAFLNANQITDHLGSSDIDRNGITFGLQTFDNHNQLVRLYAPTGVKSELVIDKIYPLIRRGMTKKGLKGIARYLGKEMLSPKISQDSDVNTRFFSSAEIMVRTMISMITEGKPFTQPLPTALLDKQGQPVGLALTFNRLPEQSRDAELEVIDTFFDLSETYGLAKSSGKIARGLYQSMKTINCLPYAENKEDLDNMLLLDGEGKFVTFNRVGYVTETI